MYLWNGRYFQIYLYFQLCNIAVENSNSFYQCSEITKKSEELLTLLDIFGNLSIEESYQSREKMIKTQWFLCCKENER